MKNISKDLKGLFKEYMQNKNKPYTTYNSNSHREPIVFATSIKVFFYEWSDVSRAPRAFYTMEAFESYLKTCGIYIQLYEKDIITNLGECFITCYKGKKQLCIRSTYKHLFDTITENEKITAGLNSYDGSWFG